MAETRTAEATIQRLMQTIADAGRMAARDAEHESLERAEALEALQQIAASFADIMAALETLIGKPSTSGPELAAALRDAVASVRPPDVQVTVKPATQPEPKVNVTVQPAPITVQPPRDQPGQKWRIDIERAGSARDAPASAFIVTRL